MAHESLPSQQTRWGNHRALTVPAQLSLHTGVPRFPRYLCQPLRSGGHLLMDGLIVDEMQRPHLFCRFPHQPEPRVRGGLGPIMQTQRKFCWLLLTPCDPSQSLRDLWVPLAQAHVASPSASGTPSFSPVSASGHSHPWTKALLRPMKCDGSDVSFWAEAVGPMPAWPCSSVCHSGWPC